MKNVDQEIQPEDLKKYLPDYMIPYLEKGDGSSRFLLDLPNHYRPEEILHLSDSNKPLQTRVWDLVGHHYRKQGRFHEALSIYASLYNHMLIAQEQTGNRGHKGMPLLWISECYLAMGLPVHAKRYLMLTLCEDAVTEQGIISPETSGTYFRLVWRHGLPDSELKRYAVEIYKLWTRDPRSAYYPEWLLQQINQNWLVEYPSPQEGAFYRVNTLYVNKLASCLGEPTGQTLERLAEYLLSCMPGCRTTRRKQSKSTDYDIICSMDGFEVDFRSEFGRYFVCECKDWSSSADFTTIAKFCRVLDSVKCRFGILFSKNGISGEGTNKDAALEQIKVFQDRGMVIIVVNQKDIEKIAEGVNFTNLLREKYEKVRLDLA